MSRSVIRNGEKIVRADPGALVHKAQIQTIKGINLDRRTIDFTISSDAVDRYDDTIDVKGWELKHYKKNPVVLFGHNSSAPPIGRALPPSIKVQGKALVATAEFMKSDISPLAESIFQMYANGFMKATSVGFRPLKWAWVDDGTRCGIDFLEQELLEFSCVPIPANPECLVNAKSLGIETAPIMNWCAEHLKRAVGKHADDLVAGIIPMAEIENIYRDAVKSLGNRRSVNVDLTRLRAAASEKPSTPTEANMKKSAGKTFKLTGTQEDKLRKKNADAVAASMARAKAVKDDPSIVVSEKPQILRFVKAEDGALTFKNMADISPETAKSGFGASGYGLVALHDNIAAYQDMDDESRALAEESVRSVLADFPEGTTLHLVEGKNETSGEVEYKSLVNYKATGPAVDSEEDAEDEAEKDAEEVTEAKETEETGTEVEEVVEAKDATEVEEAEEVVEDKAAKVEAKEVAEIDTVEKTEEAEGELVATVLRVLGNGKLSVAEMVRVFVKLADTLLETAETDEAAFEGTREAKRAKRDLLDAASEVQKLLDTDEKSVTTDGDNEEEASLDDLTSEELETLVAELMPELKKELQDGAKEGAEAELNKARGRLS